MPERWPPETGGIEYGRKEPCGRGSRSRKTLLQRHSLPDALCRQGEPALPVQCDQQKVLHQSTFNPNIPLRDLFYISCEYQKIVNDRSLYSSRLQKIPAPKFIVFYNGLQKKEDVSELRLSDAFEGNKDGIDLELKVKMLNINEGHNRELMEQCRILWEYAKYVAKVRGYTRAGLKLDEAVERAVDECIREGILAKFLSANRAEVISVSIFEYDKAEEEKKLRREEFDAGEKAGMEKGLAKGEKYGREKAQKAMLERMLEKGYSREQIADLIGIPTEQIRDLERKISAGK